MGGELLMHYGTKEQQDYWLPRLAVGKDIPCFALTSPEAGSDAGGIPDAAIVTKGQFNGEEVIGLRVSWDKRYITLAPIATADVFLTANDKVHWNEYVLTTGSTVVES